MEIFIQLLQGFQEALSLTNILACFLGVFVGTIVGVLPGIGPVGAMAILLPFSFGLDIGTSLIMLSGIYYGTMYGGSTTSILLNMPGEAASMVTCLDGYQMARRGRAGAALAVSAIGSFVAGTIGVVLLMAFAPPLGKAALSFGPPEYFAICILGMLLLSNLTGDSFLKSFLIFILGMMISTIGIDPLMGDNRLSFGVQQLFRGIDPLPLTMGVFGMAEVLSIAMEPYDSGDLVRVKFRELYPNKEELKRSIKPILRGSFLGFPIGLIPGPAAIMASLISYKAEKSLSKHPEEFGKGAIEGVAGPESANNAAASGSMVPLLALGIPFAPATALLLSGFVIHGVTPGPMFITQNSGLFWLLIAGMYVGNVMLLILNLPLVGVFASLTKLPAKILMPIVSSIMFVGVYSLNNSLFDVFLLVLFGILGYALKMAKFPQAPLVIGFILTQTLEKSFRQSMMMGEGSFLFILKRPISGTLFAVIALILITVIYRTVKRKKKIVLDD